MSSRLVTSPLFAEEPVAVRMREMEPELRVLVPLLDVPLRVVSGIRGAIILRPGESMPPRVVPVALARTLNALDTDVSFHPFSHHELST